MTHPFETKLSDLENINFDLEEITNDDELEKISGGMMTSMALGEEGGGGDVTTLALGEEGGDDVTTLALGEEGGTTFYFFEEGGGRWF